MFNRFIVCVAFLPICILGREREECDGFLWVVDSISNTFLQTLVNVVITASYLLGVLACKCHCVTSELEFPKHMQSSWASLEHILFSDTSLSCSAANKIVSSLTVIFCTWTYILQYSYGNFFFFVLISMLLIVTFITRFYYLTPSQHQEPSWK